jgi:Flp pilus assembly protein TadD
MHAAWYLYDESRRRLAAGDRPGAIAGLRASVQAHPPQFEAQSLLAFLLHEQGDHQAAIAALTIACILGPDRAYAHATLGRWHLEAGRPAEALLPLERAVRLAPDHAQTLYELGLCHLGTADYQAAVSRLRAATALAPQEAFIWTALARALEGAGDLDGAQAAHTEAWTLAPQDRETWQGAVTFMLDHERPLPAALDLLAPAALSLHDRAAQLQERAYRAFRDGRFAAARRLTTALVACTPLSPQAAHLHWFCLAQAEDVAGVQAIEPLIEPAYRAGLPADPSLRARLAWYLQERGDGAAARAEYEILAQTPMPMQLSALHAQCLIAYGPQDQGWDMLQRVALERHGDGPPPPWRGEAGAHLRLAITHPDGMGDFFNFSRYIPAAAARAQVTLVIHPDLHRIAATLCPNLTIIAPHQPVEADYHCTVAELLPVLHREVPLSAIAVPYLRAEETATDRFRARLASYPGLRVGIAWQGQHTPNWDYKRSLSPMRFARFADIPGVTLVSLQKNVPAPDFMVDWTGELRDFTDTAALIAALDLVISVDTALAHLAGALGRPVWLLNFFTCEWRWRLGRSSPDEPSPWYPGTLREFRQPTFGDWSSVLADVAEALEQVAASN